MSTLFKRLKRWFRTDGGRTGSSSKSIPADVPAVDRATIERVRPYTGTYIARILALIEAVRYLSRNRIPGDLVECGVWRGGSMMAAALTLLAEGDTSRNLYLFDTFQGMSAPTAEDKDLQGNPAKKLLETEPKQTGVWCYASLADVKKNLASTGYPSAKIHYLEGKVEETIPAFLPGPLALLRLDTDWYQSTRHELVHLYPLLVPRGILIVDDYGHWQGAKKATDEYFAAAGQYPFLQRLDYTGRLLIKTEQS